MKLSKYLFKNYFLMIGIFFISRFLLFLNYYATFKDSKTNIFLSFLYGLRMDTITASFLLVIPLFLLCFTPKSLAKLTNSFLSFYFLIVFCLIIYIENATFPFFAQYDIRPNYLFVEYLVYPKEVFATIFSEYKLELFISIILIFGFIYFYLKKLKQSTLEIFQSSYLKRVLLFLPLALILFIGIRSSFGHRPANNSDAMYSQNRILNEVTKNSLYSIAYAVYANKNDSNLNQMKKYGKMSEQEAFKRLKQRLNISNEELKNLSRPMKSNFKKKKNLVIFVQESMGAQFVEVLGGEKGITPNLNRLSKEGILFINLYSNGTRSVRGLAALSAGNFAIPGKGVIKRNKSQKDFFTFSKALKPQGYKTLFLYGGESRFDNMRGWYLGNGFDKIIDEPQFKNPSFLGTWGVSDEDLVIKANNTFKSMYEKKEKFAALMFSTTNHSPFDFPEGKIDLIKGEKVKSVKNAIKYADFAIGKFIKLAKKEAYYKDTIFVIVADHNVRVYGDEEVPVSTFQIPALILGEGIEAKKYSKLSSQPDILASAIDLIGADIKAPIMGNSIFSKEKKEISLMQFYNTYALRVKNKVAIVQPDKKAQTFKYVNKKLIPVESDINLEKDALAFVLALNYIYDEQLYK